MSMLIVASNPTPPHAHRYQRIGTVFSLLLTLATILAACGTSGSNSSTSTNAATTLRVLSAPGQPNPDLFNPFFNTNQGGDFGAQGLLYETLYFTILYNGQIQPWLATTETYSYVLPQFQFPTRSVL